MDIFCLQNPSAQGVIAKLSCGGTTDLSGTCINFRVVQILASVTINQSDAFNYPIKQIKCVLIKPVGGSGSHV